jgi:hypothetical protein
MLVKWLNMKNAPQFHVDSRSDPSVGLSGGGGVTYDIAAIIVDMDSLLPIVSHTFRGQLLA